MRAAVLAGENALAGRQRRRERAGWCRESESLLMLLEQSESESESYAWCVSKRDRERECWPSSSG